MTYPTLGVEETWQLGLLAVKNGCSPPPEDIAAEVRWVGLGETIELTQLMAEVGTWLSVAHDVDRRDPEGARLPPSVLTGEGQRVFGKDQVEGWAAARLHACLIGTDLSTIDDPGFWRYLSIRVFWPFVAWRESGSFSRFREGETNEANGIVRYFDAQQPSEDVLTRMFLRAQSVRNGDEYELAWAIRDAADFWRSHVIRVRTGEAPALTRAFVRLQLERRIDTDQLREVAKRISRLWSNLSLDQLNERECTDLLTEIWPASSSRAL